jgi:predicted peptidase
MLLLVFAPSPPSGAGALRTWRSGCATAVWLFHDAADRIVPVEHSRALKAAFERVGAHVRYTEYPGVDHVSWDLAYAEPELPPWLTG